MRSSEIRSTFLEFFRARDHAVRPSASLIPSDPSVLLTIAGMLPFKPYFLGEATAPFKRATSVQKCVRTNDIENVGRTARHGTFFEMLGNFSFGDYFKREAIAWAWELSTEHFGLDPGRIWVSVFEDDDEAEQLWLAETDVPLARIVRLGAEDNWWDTGTAGPCGPDTELFYDRGPRHGVEGGPAVDPDRYVEFYNLVFMQYERDDAGTILGELPARNVDTGMGLERMAMILQDVDNMYETDVVRPLLDRAAELTGTAYGAAADDASAAEVRDMSLRVMGDHARTSALLIADGVLPGNAGRGYVLRRLLRRAVRHARLLGHEGAVMPAMMDQVVTILGDAYPELHDQRQLVARVAAAEEEQFASTLRSGLRLLDQAVAEASGLGASELPAETAFALHDTYGFPMDLTLEIAAEHGLALDRDEFGALMEAQRRRARAARDSRTQTGVTVDVYRDAAARVGATEFLGYRQTEAESHVGALAVPGGLLEVAEEGDEVELVLRSTPFYAEGGGQLGDHGLIETPTGRIAVGDTFAPVEGLIVHRGRVTAGEVRTGQEATARIDLDRRRSITRGHTATHLLHATLKEVVGPHAVQAGSAIDQGRFRFDFPHFDSVGRDQLAELERRVNERIAADPQVTTVETSRDDAQAMGATALFGEKYGDRVRVVRIGDFSTELCGGTHVDRTGQVGVFSILTEGSIAANLRRIEATTGDDALRYLSAQRLVAEEASRLLKVAPDELVARIAELAGRVRTLERQLTAARQQAILTGATRLLDDAETVEGARVVAGEVAGADRDGLKTLATDLRNRIGSGVVVLGTRTDDGSAQLIATVTPDLAARGVSARDLLQPGARAVGGGAGGRGDTAQAGGREGGRLGEALDAVRRAARDRLGAGA